LYLSDLQKRKKTEGFVDIKTPTRFTRNIEFGKLPQYFETNLQPGIIPVATTGNNTGVITVANLDQGGKLIYYGILEKDSDFKFSPYYPIFWHELLKFSTNQKDISSMNDKTGNSLILDRVTNIKTPEGNEETNRITFDHAGLYRLPDRTIAVNLLDEQESDVNPKETIGDTVEELNLEPVREKRKFPWEIPLIIAALLMLLIETLYVKLRGDV
jgi:hypothetical protein